MVQAAQALKESTDRSGATKHVLTKIIERLFECRDFCDRSDTPFPFARALTQLIDTAQIVYPTDTSIKAMKFPKYTSLHHPKRCKRRIPKVKLGQIEVPRLFLGLWQLSSPAWGSASQEEIMDGMSDMVSNGLIAADMAGKSCLLPS